jgi:hypothetical protein
MKRLIRLGVDTQAFLLPPLIVGFVGFVSSHRATISPLTNAESLTRKPTQAPTFDSAKPTVTILLGDKLTQVTDFLAPYELFATSGAFNVYAVAPQRKRTTLVSGGLELVPHFSLTDFDGRVPKGPDVIVIPHIPNIHSAENRRILHWIKRHATKQTM